MSTDTFQLTLGSGLQADVLRGGAGAPLVYLHGRTGRRWDAFLDGLAEQFEVFAPLHPGVSDEADLERFDSIHDLVLFYDDVFEALGIDRPVIVGHSFGGMVAAEYAAHFPDKVSRLVLIDALGLWQDQNPVADIDSVAPAKTAGLLFRDPADAAAQGVLGMPDDPAEQAQEVLQRMAVVAATNHFIWPIPDRNLGRRLYRIKSPTLVLWGQDDAYVPAGYAERFRSGLANAQITMLQGAGHHPHVEQPGAVLQQTRAFLDVG